MNTDFYKNYYRYFQWNNALLNHFFSKERKEILLHVDKRLIEDLGKNIGVTQECNEDFISSVKNFCTHYERYIQTTARLEDSKFKYRQYDNKDRIFCYELVDPLIVANNIINNKIIYYERYETENGNIKISTINNKALIHELPFFAIIIYIILKFDNGNTQEWENVNNQILSIKGSSRKYILNVWKAIHQYDNRFDDDASLFDRTNSKYKDYVGRILYHLPLSATTRSKIHDAIYKSSAWKFIDTKSFLDIVGFITCSIKDNKSNDELNKLLSSSISSNDDKGVYARRVQAAIDDFDIDTYKEKLSERKSREDYNQTIISGKFALGIYRPEDDEATNSIVLLTTIQQQLDKKGFNITEGGNGSLAGYNTSLVKYNNSTCVEIKDYSLEEKGKYRITPITTENVVFFYHYDETLYIQTKEIIPSKSYVIAVRRGHEENFESWCNSNNNEVERWPHEDTCDLFGANWTIYYTENKLNGQYYSLSNKGSLDVDHSTTIIMKGGIRKCHNTYFINALPYFEIPEKYKIENIKIHFNFNGKLFEEYKKIIVGRKIILDINDMPIDNNEIAYADICIECDNKLSTLFEIYVCGQAVNYNQDNFYKFDQFGVINNDTNNAVYYGNYIKESYQKDITQYFYVKIEGFNSITDNLYFTNLLAACCYSSENMEISNSKFIKCINYAASHLDINIEQDRFINNVKEALSKAGILFFDYSNNKCQAIAPSFIRVPFSCRAVHGTQFVMLSGCYTRSFIADLTRFCNENNIGMYQIKNNSIAEEEKLLPPIILLEHNFNPKVFREEYNQQCDILTDHDFALSLLNIIPTHEEIANKFQFTTQNELSKLLEPIKIDKFPRIRSTKDPDYSRKWFIEEQDNKFAEVEPAFLAWASIFCSNKQRETFIGLQSRDFSVYLPTGLMLPHYIQRALYLMNLGLPEIKKVFICDNPGNAYYRMMHFYKLYSIERCHALVNQITGLEMVNSNTSNLIKSCLTTKYKMELWIPVFKGEKKHRTYLILKSDNNRIIAVAHKGQVYLNHKDKYQRIIANSVNEAMTFLIKNKWIFGHAGTTIGFSRNYGANFETVFNISNEEILLESENNYKIEQITII